MIKSILLLTAVALLAGCNTATTPLKSQTLPASNTVVGLVSELPAYTPTPAPAFKDLQYNMETLSGSELAFDNIWATNSVDKHLTLVHKRIIPCEGCKPFTNEHVAWNPGATTMLGFPGSEQSLVWRFQTYTGYCAGFNRYDCKPRKLRKATQRQEVRLARDAGDSHLPRPRLVSGDRLQWSYSMYIPLEFKPDLRDYSKLGPTNIGFRDNYHLGQLHGLGDDDTPIQFGIATSRECDPGSYKCYWMYGNEPKPYDPARHDSWYDLSTGAVNPGDMVLYLRGIGPDAHLQNKSYRPMYVAVPWEQLRGRWIPITVDVTLGRTPETGSMHITVDGKTIVKCEQCVTEPVYSEAGKRENGRITQSYMPKLGIWRWANKRASLGNHKPTELTVFYKDVDIQW